jgi:hypothetical protein
MRGHKFSVGQRLYYKPAAFSPLQVLPGGQCKVVKLLFSDDSELLYRVQMEIELEERVVEERDLLDIGQDTGTST